MASTTNTRAGGRERLTTRRPEPPPEKETAARRRPGSGSKKQLNQTDRRLAQPGRRRKLSQPAAGPIEIYDGRQCLGEVRDLGPVFEAWGPFREALGRFPTYCDACASIAQHARQRGAS